MIKLVSTKERLAEFSQTIEKVSIVAALGGAFLGIIPIGFATAVIGLSVATYYGAGAIKE